MVDQGPAAAFPEELIPVSLASCQHIVDNLYFLAFLAKDKISKSGHKTGLI